MHKKVLFFVDGENIVLRYQAMVKDGSIPKTNVIHSEDIYVWNPDIIQEMSRDIVRVTYYTSCSGDPQKLQTVSDEIRKIKYTFKGVPVGSGGGQFGGIRHERFESYLYPKVFHKPRKSAKSKGVDINMVIDILNYAEQLNIDAMYILTGDGDFKPLIENVIRKGKRVHLMAFSNGLNPSLPLVADDFTCLDDIFFKKPKCQTTKIT